MNPPRPHLSSARGFTLIEMMIAVAIVALLAALAYPSYKEQIARTRRGDARAVLLEDAQWLERQFTLSNAYNLKANGTTAINDNELPIKEAPKDGSAKYYDIKVFFPDTANPGRSFRLDAVRKLTGPMSDDKCGTLTLSNTGAKGVTSNAPGTDAAYCWGR